MRQVFFEVIVGGSVSGVAFYWEKKTDCFELACDIMEYALTKPS